MPRGEALTNATQGEVLRDFREKFAEPAHRVFVAYYRENITSDDVKFYSVLARSGARILIFTVGNVDEVAEKFNSVTEVEVWDDDGRKGMVAGEVKEHTSGDKVTRLSDLLAQYDPGDNVLAILTTYGGGWNDPLNDAVKEKGGLLVYITEKPFDWPASKFPRLVRQAEFWRNDVLKLLRLS